MASNQTRLYKVIEHKTGTVRLVSAYNKWQATEFVARDDYSCEVVRGEEAIKLSSKGIEIEKVVK